jgi:hypothetical protein
MVRPERRGKAPSGMRDAVRRGVESSTFEWVPAADQRGEPKASGVRRAPRPWGAVR